MTAARRFPALERRSLGIGFDLPWGAGRVGLAGEGGGEGPTAPLKAFLERGPAAGHLFFSLQPRGRARLRARDYLPAWERLAAAGPPGTALALHTTALDLGAMAPRERGDIFDLTNAIAERVGARWVNEDVGLWSIDGKPLPYPLPPVLDAGGLRACVRNVHACQRALVPPLVVEFPGFAAGASVVAGTLDAYDFFRELAADTAAPVTLDVGHLLSWRWWRGLRGEGLYGDLDRLPLDACFEIHLSGCEIAGGRFYDAHHGRLLEEQLELLRRLLPVCPHLRAVTFEDPAIEDDGAFQPTSRASLERLQGVVAAWRAEEIAPAPAISSSSSSFSAAGPDRVTGAAEPADGEGPATERALAALLFDSAARAAWRVDRGAGRLATVDPAALEEAAAAARALVRDRRLPGAGRLEDGFPRCFAGWRARHPADLAGDELLARFTASPAFAAWRERPDRVAAGPPLEVCFAAFARAEGLADPAAIDDELYGVIMRALALFGDPASEPPPGVRRCPGGWFAIAAGPPPMLHAALAAGYVRGAVTPAVVAILDGAPPRDPGAAVVVDRLVQMGLVSGASRPC